MEGLIHNTLFEKAVLIDSGALYAVADSRDQNHISAKGLLVHAQQQSFPVFVTNAVVIETYRLILHKLGRSNAHKFLNSILNDIQSGVVKLERMTEADEDAGQKMVFKYNDQDFTLTDSVNFCVMLRMGIYKIFGFDSHCLVIGLELFSAD